MTSPGMIRGCRNVTQAIDRDVEDNMIWVMGATGHTGKKIAEALLKAGEKVRALGRSKSKLAKLEGAGAEVSG
jgi:NADP-dependent 3-hydroxy acid dehydrogenase YdfG